VAAGDDAFCRLAISMGLISEEDAARALAVQRQLERRQGIGELLIARGLLSFDQVQSVQIAQGHGSGRSSEPSADPLLEEAARTRTLEQLVLLRGLATEGELEACLFLQRQLASRGEKVGLGELLVRKGYLGQNDLDDLLQLQARAENVEDAAARDVEVDVDEAGAEA